MTSSKPEEDVIMKQPNKLDLSSKPFFNEFKNKFHTGLCDLTTCRYCLCSSCCIPCFTCEIMGRMGEGLLSQIVCHPIAIPVLRPMLRTQYNIDGKMMDDLFLSCCCSGCVLAQVASELDYYGLK
ncbi:hypothetical protein SNEBB_001095 [Seison nebaliae]|nr:hypothetical protein SNEBB_001095 [Seison nebaliae]